MASADLMRMPFSAPLPVPSMIAVGVASPRAQGQEMTRTLTAAVKANSASAPSANHTSAVTTAMAITIGTKTALMRSARRATGAFEDVASSTRRMICASAVFSPTRVARMTTWPRIKSDALDSASPAPSVDFLTGMLSPVMADSSAHPSPSITTPSTGTRSPVFTTTSSPTTIESIGTVTTAPLRRTSAISGTSAMRRPRVSVVRALARASKNFPSVMSVRIIAAESK